jgi:hypothetical protein
MKWWLIILFIADISAYATATFCSLEGLTTLLFAQCQGLICLQSNYMHLIQLVGPIEGNANVDKNFCALADDRKVIASFVSIASVIEDIGTFAVDTLDTLDVVEKNYLYQMSEMCCKSDCRYY